MSVKTEPPQYPVGAADLPIETLRLALKKSRDLLYELDPRKMEEVVASVFRDYYSCIVHHIGRTGNGGIDLLLVEAENEVIVQVKRRASKDATEGVSLIREVIGATLLSGRRNAAIVSTGRFTRGAEKTAQMAVQMGIVERLDLIDLPHFLDMLQLTGTAMEQPWMHALRGKVGTSPSAGELS